MIVRAGFSRSELGRLMSQARLARIAARPVRAVSGQRNASHGPCTLDVADDRGQFIVRLWLLLLLAGTSVVRPALLSHWEWQRHGVLRDDPRRDDCLGRARPWCCAWSSRNGAERPGADHGAPIVPTADSVNTPAGPDYALPADQTNGQLTAHPVAAGLSEPRTLVSGRASRGLRSKIEDDERPLSSLIFDSSFCNASAPQLFSTSSIFHILLPILCSPTEPLNPEPIQINKILSSSGKGYDPNW